jgi:hypothetical protein
MRALIRLFIIPNRCARVKTRQNAGSGKKTLYLRKADAILFAFLLFLTLHISLQIYYCTIYFMKGCPDMKKNGFKHPNDVKILASRTKNGIFFQLCDESGETRFLACRRFNAAIYDFFKGGVSLGEIRRMKKSRSARAQNILHYTQHLLRIIDYLEKYELAG